MTFVVTPGGPAVFSHGAVAPFPDLERGALAAAGVLWSARIGTIRIAAAIASLRKQRYCELTRLIALGSNGECGSISVALRRIAKRFFSLICVLELR
jgi:hypothetical protein